MMSNKDAPHGFDVATSLLMQCRMAHQQLQAAGVKQEKLLNRLCGELQSLQKSQVSENLGDASRDDSEVDSFPMPIHLPERAQETHSRRSSVHSTESRISRASSGHIQRHNSRNSLNSRNVTMDLESDPVTHSYSINGITRKEPAVPRSSFWNVLKTTFGTDKRIADSLEKCWQKEEPERRGWLARLVRSNFFGVICGAVIFANAIFILYATDYDMQNVNHPAPMEDTSLTMIRVIELLLASFYVLELALKLIVHKCFFFWNSEMLWNWFLGGLF